MSINFIGAVWDSGLYDGPRLLMMLALADHADNDGWCFPHYDTLALKIRRNVKTVYRILSDLEADGALRRLDNRIGICEPHILAEVRRRAKSRHPQQAGEPPEPLPVSEDEPSVNVTKSDPQILTSENESGDTEDAILTSETQFLNSEKAVLTSETQILTSETPFLIDPSINRQLNRHKPATASATGPAAPATVAAVPVPDTIPDILRWVGFVDQLTEDEKAWLDPVAALAWTYWIRLESDRTPSNRNRVRNPVGLARAQWRKGVRPRDDLLALARCWLDMPPERRRVLLDGCDFVARYGGEDPALDDEFPGVPISAAVAIFRATNGELGPSSLMPPATSTSSALAVSVARPKPPAASNDLWTDALKELRHQMARATFAQWLQGTTAALADDELTVYVRNQQAVAWLTERLHPVVGRTVAGLAGRPITVRYIAPEAT